MNYSSILDFWFVECTPADWWKKSPGLDQTIKEKFAVLHTSASKGELFEWRQSAKGSLAEIILLDQFSRNIYRNTKAAFGNDVVALVLAQTAIDKGFASQLSIDERQFLYMPFMHSESIILQNLSKSLFENLGNENALQFAVEHSAIITRFGRFPHRNQILGRKSTTEEIEFLKQHSGF